MDSFLVVSVLVGSGLCSVEHTPEDSILVANTNACEECSVSVDIDIDEVVPVHSLTVCLWLKPSYFYRSTAAFSIWSENQKAILTLSVQDNIIEVSRVTSEVFPLTQITIGEWVHLCILYGPFLFVTIAVPGEDAPPQVFEFHTLFLNIQNGSKVIAVVGANQEEYHPLFGRFADIRIYWRLLGQEELAKLFRFEAFSDDFISVLDLIANDPSDPNVVVGDAIDKIDKFGLVEGEGARKAVSLNRIMVSSILKPRVEHFHWYFSKKVSCNDGKQLCTRFGGVIINSIGDAMCRNLLDEFKKGEGDSGSFWILSSRATCIKGRYKNDNLFTSDTNVTDKLSTICLLSKKQNFYFHDGNSILTFLAVPDHNALFKGQQDYSILKYDAEQKKAYIKTLLDNSPFEEAAIENEIRLMGRHNWTSNSGDRRNRRAIFSICTRGQFTCSNGDCIDMTKVCNDLKDCADESDEEFCEIGINPIGFYDRRGAPLINDGLFTKVSLNILLVRVGLIDMDSHTISLNLIVTAKWRDPRLKFKYLEENKTMLIGHDISRKFWSPKITMTTAISSDKQHFDMNKYPGPMYAVSSDQPKLEVFDGYEAFIFDGDKVDIIHEKSESVTFLCDMDLFLFPFDYQKCNITFVLESLLNPDAFWNPEAIGVRVRQRRDPTLYNSLGFFLPGPVPNDTHELNITFSVIRENKAYVLTTFLPFVLLKFIGLMTFLMPWDDNQDRVTVTLSSLIVMATLFSQISSALPKTSTPKMIDIWMFIHVFLLFLVFMFNVMVVRTYKRATNINRPIQGDFGGWIISRRTALRRKHPSSKLAFVAEELDDDPRKSTETFMKINNFALVFCSSVYFVFLLVFFCISFGS